MSRKITFVLLLLLAAGLFSPFQVLAQTAGVLIVAIVVALIIGLIIYVLTQDRGPCIG